MNNLVNILYFEFKTNFSISQLTLKYKNGRPHFGNLKTRTIWCYRTLWRQNYVDKILATCISFLLTPGPTIYQSSSLSWTLKFTSNFLKVQLIFIEWTTARMKICLSESLNINMKRFFNIMKLSSFTEVSKCLKVLERSTLNYL